MMTHAMSISLTTETATSALYWPLNSGLDTFAPAKEKSRIGFLRFVWVAMVLSVVAVVEPAPGDIGIAVLLLLGFGFGKLSWTNMPVVPVMLLGLFVVANLVSMCYAIDVAYGAAHGLITVFMLTFWLFTLGVVTKFKEQGLRIMMSGYTVGGVLSAGLALLAYLGVLSKVTSSIPVLNSLALDDTLLFYGERIRGFFKDPNVFGPYMVVIAGYALCQLQSIKGSSVRKMFWIASCLIASLSVLLSFSRAAWANYAVTLAVVGFLTTMANRGRKGSRRGIITFLIVSVIVAAAVGYALTNRRVNQVAVDRSEMQSYDEERFIKHAEALELGLNNPLGIGPGQSHLALGYNPHSLPLALFAENGVIGVLSLMGFVLVTMIRSLVLSQRAKNKFQRSLFALVAAAIAGTLLNSTVIDPIHWRHFWFLLALGWMPLFTNSATPALQTLSRRLNSSQTY